MENNTYITITARQRDDAGEEAVTRSAPPGTTAKRTDPSMSCMKKIRKTAAP